MASVMARVLVRDLPETKSMGNLSSASARLASPVCQYLVMLYASQAGRLVAFTPTRSTSMELFLSVGARLTWMLYLAVDPATPGLQLEQPVKKIATPASRAVEVSCISFEVFIVFWLRSLTHYGVTKLRITHETSEQNAFAGSISIFQPKPGGGAPGANGSSGAVGFRPIISTGWRRGHALW